MEYLSHPYDKIKMDYSQLPDDILLKILTYNTFTCKECKTDVLYDGVFYKCKGCGDHLCHFHRQRATFVRDLCYSCSCYDTDFG